jgi:hypothetical protein
MHSCHAEGACEDTYMQGGALGQKAALTFENSSFFKFFAAQP